jgi:hypothetical protein
MSGAAVLFLLLVVGLLTFPIILGISVGFLAGLWEKRLVWPYVSEVGFETEAEPDRSNPYAPPVTRDPMAVGPYASAVCQQAEQLGFRPIGHRFDGKGKLYKIRYDFWLAPDRIVLAMIGGKLAGITLEATWLYTRLGNGHCVVTLDEPKGGDSDMSGMTEQFVLARADFAELLGRRRERIAAADSPVLPFSADDPLADLRAFRAARAGKR